MRVVIDPDESNLSSEQINALHSLDDILLAYLNIGEAENYRCYWHKDWYVNPLLSWIWKIQIGKELLKLNIGTKHGNQ